MPPELQERASAKALQAKQYYEQRFAPGALTIAATYGNLAWNQQPQQGPSHCGPAAVSEATDAKGKILAQGDTGSGAYYLLCTDCAPEGGTNWTGVNARVPGPTGRPVLDVLNYWLNTNFYAPVDLPYSPTQADKNNYVWDLVFDIDNKWPVVGDAWEEVGGPHLVGHPNWKIYHWVEIRGYLDNGWTTRYEDSAANSPYVQWPSPPGPVPSLLGFLLGYYRYNLWRARLYLVDS
jgi:hypothetical protein